MAARNGNGGSGSKRSRHQSPHLRLTNPAIEPHPDDPWTHTRYQRLAAYFTALSLPPPLPPRGLPITIDPNDPRSRYGDEPSPPTFNLITELAHSRHEYIPERPNSGPSPDDTDDDGSGNSGAWFTVRSFPTQLYTQLGRLQSQASDDLNPHERCGVSPALACCLFYGLALINRDRNVARLGVLRDALDRYNNLPPAGEFIYNFWQGWQFQISHKGSSRKVNSCIPEDIKESLATISRQVGIHESSVAVVATSLALSDCSSTMRSSAGTFRATADTFTAFVDIKADMAASLVSRYVPKLARRPDILAVLTSPPPSPVDDNSDCSDE